MQPWGNVNFRMYPAPSGRHMGVDIGGLSVGAPIFAVADGIVDTAAQINAHGYGRHLIIQHNGCRSLYAHLHKLFVREGQQVHAGDQIGEMGGDPKDNDPIDGASTGTHLHFEIIMHLQPEGDSVKTWAGYTVDPFPFLLNLYAAPPIYTGKVIARKGVRVRTDKSVVADLLTGLSYLAEVKIVDTVTEGNDVWAKLWSMRPEWVAVRYNNEDLIELTHISAVPENQPKPMPEIAPIDEKQIRIDEIDAIIAMLKERKVSL